MSSRVPHPPLTNGPASDPAGFETAGQGYCGYHHYLPIPERLFEGHIYVTCAGKGWIGPGCNYPPTQHPSLYHFNWAEGRTLPEFCAVFITEGRGIFESRETGRVTIEGSSVFLLFPGVWHRYQPLRETGWTEKWVGFNGELAHRLWDDRIISTKRPILTPAHPEQVESALERLIENIHADPSSNSLMLSLQALQVLTLSLNATAAEPAPAGAQAGEQVQDPIVAAALDYIWTRSHHVLSVPDVADQLGITRRTLERHMDAVLGRSVLDEIIRCRFARAERLLRETDLPIKSVVTLAGFGSPENMRQVFLSRTKMSPAQYRTAHGANRQGRDAGPPA